MADLLDRGVEIEDIVAASTQTARALEDPLRARILDLVSHEAMSVRELEAALEEEGVEKATTTIRHHVNVLREAGLIELGRLEEGPGGVVKYYAATTRFLDYDPPEGFGDAIEDVVATAEGPLAELVEELRAEHGEAIAELAEQARPCPRCERRHFEEYVIARVLQRALARALDGG